MPLLTTQSAKGYGFSAYSAVSLSDFVVINSTTVTGSSSLISFSSIPQTYSSLWIMGNAVATSGAPNIKWTYNGSSSGYNYLYMENATAGNNSSYASALGGTISTNGSSVLIQIPDYSRTDKYKTAKIQTGDYSYVSTIGNCWQNTAAITSIEFSAAGTSFAVGTSLTLYGLR